MQHSLYLAFFMAVQDLKGRYRRTIIGPLWITLSSFVLIVTIGFVFGSFVEVDFEDYFLSVACGIVFWQFIANTLSDSCFAFLHSEPLIKQLRLPLYVHIFRVIFRNLFALGHSLIILPIIFVYFGKPVGMSSFLLIFTIMLMIVVLYVTGSVLAFACARYRDFAQIVASLLQVLFYATPIMWVPSQVAHIENLMNILMVNPFYHFIEILRGPIFGGHYVFNVKVVIMYILVMTGPCYILFKRLSKYLAYWL